MNWYLKSSQKYFVEGVILGCFKDTEGAKKKYGFIVDEDFPGDPWIASVKTKDALGVELINQLCEDYSEDPDKKGVPYYFIIRSVDGSEFVVFSDDCEWHSIDIEDEKKKAIEIGSKKGLEEKYLDF